LHAEYRKREREIERRGEKERKRDSERIIKEKERLIYM